MIWKDVNHTHNGLGATVKPPGWVPGTPQGTEGAGIFGIIKCEKKGYKPMLQVGEGVTHMFVWWYEVELLDA